MNAQLERHDDVTAHGRDSHKLKLTGTRCCCGACGQYFNSISSFDLHRSGIHGLDRRCREPSEMVALGMRKNALGFWIERGRQDRYQKRRPATQETRSPLALAQGAV